MICFQTDFGKGLPGYLIYIYCVRKDKCCVLLKVFSSKMIPCCILRSMWYWSVKSSLGCRQQGAPSGKGKSLLSAFGLYRVYLFDEFQRLVYFGEICDQNQISLVFRAVNKSIYRQAVVRFPRKSHFYNTCEDLYKGEKHTTRWKITLLSAVSRIRDINIRSSRHVANIYMAT